MCPDDTTVRVPLRAKDGSVRAYALIDATDADWVNQWRWCLNSNGYAKRRQVVDGRQIMVLLHRELLGLIHNDGLEGDHRNRNRLDNRRGNLRVVTRAENRQNRSSRVVATSSHRGVYWKAAGQKWAATITVGGKRFHLGYFTNEDDAHKAAQEARSRLMPYATD